MLLEGYPSDKSKNHGQELFSKSTHPHLSCNLFSLLRMVTPTQIKYCANGKPKTTKYLPAIVVYPYIGTYLFIDLLLFSLSPSFHFAVPSFHLVPITETFLSPGVGGTYITVW